MVRPDWSGCCPPLSGGIAPRGSRAASAGSLPISTLRSVRAQPVGGLCASVSMADASSDCEALLSLNI